VTESLQSLADSADNLGLNRNRRRSRLQPGRSTRFRLPTAVVLWVALSMVASNLTLVALRSDLTRVRYELSQGTGEMRRLNEEHRALTLTLRKLRDPRRLRAIARARGFGPPERIVELP